jgi:hypothetical protein
MSLHKLNLSNPANNLIWSHFNMNLLVFTMNGELLYYKFIKKNETVPSDSYEMIGKLRIEIEDIKSHNTSIQHITWTREDELIIIADTKYSGFKLIVFKIDDSNFSLSKQ